MIAPLPMDVQRLFQKVGSPADITGWTALPGGRNNQVYRLDTPAGSMLLKRYFLGGEWDRLAAENRFLQFCQTAGVGRVARLLADDPSAGLALHSWLDGDRLEPDEVGQRDVAEAAAFFAALVKATREHARAALPFARDAARCLADFMHSPQQRLAELQAALLANPRGWHVPEAFRFLRERLIPGWERARRLAEKRLAGEDGLRHFTRETLVVSPSDFGFHNALRLADGSLGFVDFEYAGLDSPIKAIADFVCQPSVPPPEGTVEILAPDGDLRQAVEDILPLNRVKFCCVILNDFKSLDACRRDFSLAGNTEERLGRQLEKATRYYEKHLETT